MTNVPEGPKYPRPFDYYKSLKIRLDEPKKKGGQTVRLKEQKGFNQGVDRAQ